MSISWWRARRSDSRRNLHEYAPDLVVARRGIDLDGDARNEGKHNRPPTDAQELNASEQIIVDHFSNEHSRLCDLTDHEISRIRSRVLDGSHAPLDENLKALLGGAELDIQSVRVASEGRLRPLYQAQRQAERDLRAFRHEHRRNFEARYPSSVIRHSAIVVLVALGESIANMYFFAQGNDLGLLGGVLQSFLISLTNVGVAVLVGIFALRQLNHIGMHRRLLGAALIIPYLAFLPFFNLAAAHYRDLLAEAQPDALFLALANVLVSPFQLSFDSLMLFVVGILISAVALYKGYTADDKYPGYGEQSRHCAKARQAYDDAVDEVRDRLLSIVSGIREQTAALLARLEARIDLVASDVRDLKSGLDYHEACRQSIQDKCRRYLKRYREINMKIRDPDNGPPAYFDDYPSFEAPGSVVLGRTEYVKRAENSLAALRDARERLGKEVEKVHQGLAKRIEEVALQLDATLEKVVGEVEAASQEYEAAR